MSRKLNEISKTWPFRPISFETEILRFKTDESLDEKSSGSMTLLVRTLIHVTQPVVMAKLSLNNAEN